MTDQKTQDACPASLLNERLDMTLYRCGYCGGCTDKDGNTIDWFESDGWDTAEQTQGMCCAGTHGTTPGRQIITREMAMDAQMPELEGRYV